LAAPSPEQLDRPLRVSTSLAGVALAALILALAAAMAWSLISSAPVKVAANGILLSMQGVGEVTANAEGRVTTLRVAVGERVRAGQVVAELGQPDLGDRMRAKRLELEGLRAERDQLRLLAARTFAATEAQRSLRHQALEVQAGALERRLATLREIEAGTGALLASGVVTRMRVLEAVNERSRAENELNETRRQRLLLRAESEEQHARDEREALRADFGVATAERELELLRAFMGRSDSVLALVDGTVTEVNVGLGDVVRPGMPLVRLLLGATRPSDLQVVAYVPGGGGKRVRPGMEAQVIPATVRLQRDGFIEGRVVSVADLPASRESMLRVLKNAALVDQLTRGGPPYEVVVALAADPAAPTGFRWSTGRGPTHPIEVGTIAEARIVVDRLPVISLVVPRAETVLEFLRHRAAPAPALRPDGGAGAPP